MKLQINYNHPKTKRQAYPAKGRRNNQFLTSLHSRGKSREMTTNEIIKAMISEDATVKVLRFRKETWELIKKDGATVRLRSSSAYAAIRGGNFKPIEQTLNSTIYAYRPVTNPA